MDRSPEFVWVLNGVSERYFDLVAGSVWFWAGISCTGIGCGVIF